MALPPTTFLLTVITEANDCVNRLLEHHGMDIERLGLTEQFLDLSKRLTQIGDAVASSVLSGLAGAGQM
jgi:hypothetical protein